MTDYVMETKIELIKTLTEIEIKLKTINIEIHTMFNNMNFSQVINTPQYEFRKTLRKQRDKLNSVLNSMEVDNV